MDAFFDAHFHPTLKKQFANPDETPAPGELPLFNPWRTGTRQDFLKGFKAISPTKCLIKPFVEQSFVSQSSLEQLQRNGFKLAVVALFCPDRGLMRLLTDSKAFMSIVRKGKFGNTLNEPQLKSLIDQNNPFEVVLRDLALLDLPNAQGQTPRRVQSSQFVENDVPAVVFSVEGLHCLRSNLHETHGPSIVSDILSNLDSLLQAGHRVVMVNLAHIDDSNTLFCNQAYAMDGFREGGFDERHLRPRGNGLSDWGRQISQALYDRAVLPDLKHMSWLARREFYAFRQSAGITAPLVCSHAGFTGCWFDKHGERWSDYCLPDTQAWRFAATGQKRMLLAKPNPYLTDHAIGFNASSINLFNEDIEEILASEGLIGLSLDQRILGYSEFVDDEPLRSDNVVVVNGTLKILTDSDFIADAEVATEVVFEQTTQRFDKISQCVRTSARITQNSSDVAEFFHPRHFYLHVAHAIAVARSIGGEAAATQILTQTLCIGSDFDGLIDGLDCCPDTDGMGRLKALFKNEFGAFLNEAGIALPAGLSVATIAERIFYENGRDFVLKRVEAIKELLS